MSIFNFEKLSHMQKGRVQEVLDRVYRFEKEGVMTLGEFLTSRAHGKAVETHEGEYDRRAFNAKNSEQQRAYLERLKRPRYVVFHGDDYTMQIPKIVWDILSLPLRD